MESREITFRDRLRQVGPAAVLGFFWMTAPAVMGLLLLYFIGPASDWLLAQPGLGLLVYIGVFILAAGLGLLPTYALALLGGWVFGLAFGLPAALAGFVGAALVGYLVARRVSGEKITLLIERDEKARTIRRYLVGQGNQRTAGVVALLRLPPQSPFAVTNLVMAGTGVPIMAFIVGTFLGMVPRTAVAVVFAASAAGTGARDIQSLIRDGPGWAVSAGGLVLMFIVLGFIGYLSRRALTRFSPNDPSEPETGPAVGSKVKAARV